MPEKLDPRLLELVERSNQDVGESARVVEVVVGLDAPLDSGIRRDLVARGLSPRSELGTVLTGTIKLGDVSELADSPRVVKIEASAPLFRESADVDGGLPTE
jgi:hypothetical protein